jgi:hypothetical protein
MAETPFAIYQNKDGRDEFFVELRYLMSILTATLEGFTEEIVTFPESKGKTLYIPIDLAIAWIEKEMDDDPQCLEGKGLEVECSLKIAKEKFESECVDGKYTGCH